MKRQNEETCVRTLQHTEQKSGLPMREDRRGTALKKPHGRRYGHERRRRGAILGDATRNDSQDAAGARRR
jgi:hypothetical protein